MLSCSTISICPGEQPAHLRKLFPAGTIYTAHLELKGPHYPLTGLKCLLFCALVFLLISTRSLKRGDLCCGVLSFKTVSLRLGRLPFQNNLLKNLHTKISIYIKELIHPHGCLLVPHKINYSRVSSGNH